MTKRAVETTKSRHILTRLLDTPNLVRVVQSLEPKVLHQLVRHCGLEDCGEIVALATTEQLMRVFDDDLWRSDEAGAEDEFDADRFGLWLEVLAEVGVATAAKKLVEMDFDFVTAALSRHLLVLDQETVILGETASRMGGVDAHDPLEIAQAVLTENALEDCLHHNIGGYEVIAKRGESWDALLPILVSLEEDHRPFFGKLMKRCCHLSTEHIEDNGGLFEVLTSDEQVMADVARDREERREQGGYVAPSQAVAFLKLARQPHDGDDGAALASDPLTTAYFREFRAPSKRSAEQREHGARARIEGGRAPATKRQDADVLSTLRKGGVIEPSRLPLRPEAMVSDGGRLSRIRAQLLFVQEHDRVVYSRRTEELAYLANVLIAGCSFQSRRFGSAEAADAVLAVCNLGLENWLRPSAAARSPELPLGFLLRQDVVAVFRRGFGVLHEEVCVYVAERLIEVLSDLRCDDEELQDDLRHLRQGMKTQLAAGTPWLARDGLDVIAILDQPSWAILLGLIDECPVMPKLTEPPADGRRPLRVIPGFDFISENRQVAWVRDFARSLPEKLVDT